MTFLKGKLGEMSDTYTLALVAYAFELADDPAKETVIAELMKKVVREGKTKSLTLFIYWIVLHAHNYYKTTESVNLQYYLTDNSWRFEESNFSMSLSATNTGYRMKFVIKMLTTFEKYSEI